MNKYFTLVFTLLLTLTFSCKEENKTTQMQEVMAIHDEVMPKMGTIMMDWMKGFGDRFTGEEIMKGKPLSDEKKALLDEEEKKVKALRDLMNSSIEKAQVLVN